ncbi:MAG: hypothetical protein K5986_05605 [Clostridium sp.]|nr:hypothetical protein [Clostridium sp.]
MFGFKKKPENDINQYYVCIVSRNPKCIVVSNTNHKNFIPLSLIKESIADGDKSIHALTAKQAVKYCEKHDCEILLQPSALDEDIIRYFEEKVPRYLWRWDPDYIEVVH